MTDYEDVEGPKPNLSLLLGSKVREKDKVKKSRPIFGSDGLGDFVGHVSRRVIESGLLDDPAALLVLKLWFFTWRAETSQSSNPVTKTLCSFYNQGHVVSSLTSVRRISKKLNMSRSSVKRHISKAIKSGWIRPYKLSEKAGGNVLSILGCRVAETNKPVRERLFIEDFINQPTLEDVAHHNSEDHDD